MKIHLSFHLNIVKSYNEESDEKYFLEVDVQYSEKLQNVHNDLQFLSERMKIEKFEKLVANLHNQKEFVFHLRNLEQGLSRRLVHSVFKFNQKPWLKP